MLADLILIALFSALEAHYSSSGSNYARFRARFGRWHEAIQALYRETGIFLQEPLGYEETALAIGKW